jgi:uncharacterized membrane protein YgcG
MVPHFKNEKYYEGLESGIRELIRQWK